MIEKNNFALVVDDKRYGREAGSEVMRRLGYSDDNILIARYGDEALNIYKDNLSKGHTFGLVLTDYHMDVVNKSTNEDMSWSKKPVILDGVTLTNEVLKSCPQQKVIVVSGGVDLNILNDINNSGALAGLYKRRPTDEKFEGYVEAIKDVIATGKTNHVKGMLSKRLNNAIMQAGMQK